MKKFKLFPLILACLLLVSCSNVTDDGRVLRNFSDDAIQIFLSDEAITIGGETITADTSAAVYLSNDIIYYKDGTDFTYGEGTSADMHTAEEASEHKVITITEPGDYVLKGTLSKGQIAVDLGEDAEDDPNAVVTLALSDANITCTVAPAIVFYNVYECGDDDEDDSTADVDTAKAGANIIIADNTENTLNGAYVAKIYESVELSEDKTKVVDSKKLHKYDATLYSKMSMNIYGGELGNGILNINAENEGLGTELHLTIYGGKININSANDGINTNEDYVSVTTIKGGELNITVNGKTGEGDGIDSNGWLVIEGGKVNAFACSDSMDSGLDSDKGILIRGGDVAYTGNMFDAFESKNNSVTFMFTEKQKGGVSSYTIKNKNGEEVLSVTPKNDFSQLVVVSESLSEGEYSLYCDGKLLKTSTSAFGGGMRPNGGRPNPEGGARPGFEGKEMPNFEGKEIPDFKGGERPDFGGKAPENFPGDKEFKGGKRGEARPEFNGESPRERSPENMPPEFNGKMPDFSSQWTPQIDESSFSDTFKIEKGQNNFMVK